MKCSGCSGFCYTLIIDSCAHAMKRGYVYNPANPEQQPCFTPVKLGVPGSTGFYNFLEILK